MLKTKNKWWQCDVFVVPLQCFYKDQFIFDLHHISKMFVEIPQIS